VLELFSGATLDNAWTDGRFLLSSEEATADGVQCPTATETPTPLVHVVCVTVNVGHRTGTLEGGAQMLFAFLSSLETPTALAIVVAAIGLATGVIVYAVLSRAVKKRDVAPNPDGQQFRPEDTPFRTRQRHAVRVLGLFEPSS
jgi:hypothetical protein